MFVIVIWENVRGMNTIAWYCIQQALGIVAVKLIVDELASVNNLT